MIHPELKLTFINDSVGFGLVASEPLPRGTITWTQDPLDHVLSDARFAALGPAFERELLRYAWRNREGDWILCWDHGRFMNHSCRPNSLSPGLDFEVAVRDIEAGEEVTCDYAALNLEASFRCACGLAECRGEVHGEDFERLSGTWDASLREAFSGIGDVPQPLYDILSVADRSAIIAGLCDPILIPSAIGHRLAAPS